MYRIITKDNNIIECDTVDEVLALTKRLGIVLIPGKDIPFTEPTKPATPVPRKKPSKVSNGTRSGQKRHTTSADDAPSPPARMDVPVAARSSKPKVVSVIGISVVLDTLALNKSKVVDGVTLLEVQNAIDENKEITGKDFSIAFVTGGSVKIKRIL